MGLGKILIEYYVKSQLNYRQKHFIKILGNYMVNDVVYSNIICLCILFHQRVLADFLKYVMQGSFKVLYVAEA